MDPAKLKVVELRAALSQRGLDTKGNKAVLVERLRKALEETTDNKVPEAAPADTQESGGEKSPQPEREKTPEPNKSLSPSKSPGRASRSVASPRSTPTKASAKAVHSPPSVQKQSPTVKSPVLDKPESPIIDKKTEAELLEEDEPESVAAPQTTIEESDELPKADTCPPQVAQEAPEIPPTQPESVQQPEPAPTETAVPEIAESPEAPEPPKVTDTSEPVEEFRDSQECERSSENNDLPEFNDDQNANEQNEEKMQVSEESTIKNESEENFSGPEDQKPPLEDIKQESSEEKSNVQIKQENETTESEEKPHVKEDVDMKPAIKQEDEKDRKDRKERKRRRSTSSDRHKSPPPVKTDDEPEIDYSRVLLSWYDSDLNLVINKSTFLSATPMHNDGFGYVWAGARASFGFTTGKVYYEVKVTHECSLTIADEEYPHVLRAGWSVTKTSMQLGEEKLSYGYGGTGKISTGNSFKDYGPRFGLNDVLGCYLDLSGDNALIRYTLNGKDLGQAFSVPKSELEDKALFPHILTKNCEFVCNFGDEEPWGGTPLEGYVPVGKVDIKDRVPGPVRPEKREECEMLMMCGLPGSGKTYWCTNYALENPDKMYNVLGTNNLIEKMKVIGLPRKRNYHGRWEVLIDKCTRCLNKLLDVAASRRRNYILDQTNVYPSAQRRKMRHFYGFQRKAIVIVPTEEEFKSRTAKREAIEGKEVPDSAILEMKANFTAPVVGDSFDAVEWIELGEEEAKKLIAKYNKEGKDAGFAQQQATKRPRFEKSSDSHRDNRDVRSSRDSRNSRDHHDRRNAYSDRNRNSTWRGGNHMSGGWRDRGPRSGPPHMRQSSSSYASGPAGWRGRTGPSGPMHRPSDRRGPSSDRRSGVSERRSSGPVRQGGWGPMNSNYHNSGSSGSWGGSSQSGGWSGGGSQSQSGWGSGQGGWGAQQGNWGSWKGYGSNSNYNQSSYGQQGYGNGNWGGWNQQYYNQYWSQQQPSSGPSSAASGQSATSGGNSTSAASTGNTGSTYNSYPQGWQGYTQSYNYATDGSSSSTQQQK